jgi:DNA repair exonuclease SbcCD nuclease subunit
MVEEAKKHTNNIILNAHINIVGAVENNYTVVDTDFQLSPAELHILAEHGIIAAFLGHIHKRQEFFPHFGYVGTLFQHDFREAGNSSGFDYVEISDGKILKHSFQKINVPEHIIINIDSLQDLEKVLSDQDNTMGDPDNKYMLKINAGIIPSNFDIKIKNPANVKIQLLQTKNYQEQRTTKSAAEISEMKELDYIKLYCSDVKKMPKKEIDNTIKFYKDTIGEFDQ